MLTDNAVTAFVKNNKWMVPLLLLLVFVLLIIVISLSIAINKKEGFAGAYSPGANMSAAVCRDDTGSVNSSLWSSCAEGLVGSREPYVFNSTAPGQRQRYAEYAEALAAQKAGKVLTPDQIAVLYENMSPEDVANMQASMGAAAGAENMKINRALTSSDMVSDAALRDSIMS